MSQDSSVGTATRHGLDGPGIESRWGATFSTPVQTGSGAHPASYTMDTGSFPGVKAAGALRLTPRLKKNSAIPLFPLWAFVPCSRVTFTFTFLHNMSNTLIANISRNCSLMWLFANFGAQCQQCLRRLVVQKPVCAQHVGI